MAVQINVAANQAALTASIQAGVQAYNQRFAQNNQLNLTINPRAFSQPLGRITGDVKDFEAALAASNARVIAFGASTAVLGGVIRSFKELANVTIEVEKNLADINRVFGLTTSQLQKFSTDLFNVTKQTASSFNDASQAALEFSRQGLKAEETLQRTKDALTLTRLAGISTANAVDALTSTVNGFSATGVTTTQILNKLVAVEQDFAVGAGDLAEALSRTGQAAQEAGVSLDQLNALVTSAQQSTARGGAVIGNALKTIFTRLQRTDTLDQLEAFNIAVRDVQGNILPAVTILQNFAGAYRGLADAQRAQLSEQVAGVYQVNILKAIVNDLNKSQGVYAGALQRGAMATNEAEVATAKLNQTLDALLKQTATSTQQLANNIGKVTFEPLARYGTEQLKSLVESMNEILEGEGIGSTFANGLLKGIRNILAGPGAIAAFFTLFKLIQNSFTYLSQALPQIAGITTETQNRKNIEQAILQIMAQQGPVAQALAGTMGNQAAQAQLLLQVARQQTAEYQTQTALARQLAGQLAGQGVRVRGAGGLQVTRAGGYIPASTKMAEVVGAQAGGYAPGRVVSSPVGGVMNTAEDVKYVPGFAQPFINPPAGSKAGRAHRQNSISRTGVDPYMYRGFIPNFVSTSLDAIKLNENKVVRERTDFFDNFTANINPIELEKNINQYRQQAENIIGSSAAVKRGTTINGGIYTPKGQRNPSQRMSSINRDNLAQFIKTYRNQVSRSTLKRTVTSLKRLDGNFEYSLNQVQGLLGEADAKNLLKNNKVTQKNAFFDLIKDDGSLAEVRTRSRISKKDILVKAILERLTTKRYDNKTDEKIDLGSYDVVIPKGSPLNSQGFIPNFATPMTTASIPWFKKYSSKYKNAAGDADLFKMGDFPTYGRGLDHEYAKKGNSAMLSYLHEDFVRSALNIALGSKKVIRPAEVGFKDKPVSDISNENDFDLLYRIADGSYSMLELKQDFKNISGSVTGFMNKKLANLEKENPRLAKKVSSMIAVSNRPKFTDPTGRNVGANFSEFEMAAASIVKDKYSNVDPSISAKLTKVTDGLLRRYEAKKNTTYDGFIPNFAYVKSMIARVIPNTFRSLTDTKGTAFSNTNIGIARQKSFQSYNLTDEQVLSQAELNYPNLIMSILGNNAFIPDIDAIDKQSAGAQVYSAANNVSSFGGTTANKSGQYNPFGGGAYKGNPELIGTGSVQGKAIKLSYANVGKLGRRWEKSKDPVVKDAWANLQKYAKMKLINKAKNSYTGNEGTAFLNENSRSWYIDDIDKNLRKYSEILKTEYNNYLKSINRIGTYVDIKGSAEAGLFGKDVNYMALRPDVLNKQLQGLPKFDWKNAVDGIFYGDYKNNKEKYDRLAELMGKKWTYNNASKRMFLQSGGFIPNFAYKQAVMGLEESMSGNKAIFDTKPFPHIRNSGQPTFSSAIADHGGLSNALSDSMRGQKAAGLMSRGFVPNFAPRPYRYSGRGSVVDPSSGVSQYSASLGLALADQERAARDEFNRIINALRNGAMNAQQATTAFSTLNTQAGLSARAQTNLTRILDREVNAAATASTSNTAGGAGGSRFSRFSRGLSRAGTAISIAGPTIAGFAEQSFFGDRKRSEMSSNERMAQSFASTGLSAVTTGVGIGAQAAGLPGALIGGAVGGLVALKSALDSTSLSIDELKQKKEEEKNKIIENISSAERYLAIQEEISKSTSPKDIKKNLVSLRTELSSIKDADFANKIKVAGTDINSLSAIVQEYSLKQKEATSVLNDAILVQKKYSFETLKSAGILKIQKEGGTGALAQTKKFLSGGFNAVAQFFGIGGTKETELGKLDFADKRTRETVYKENPNLFKSLSKIDPNILVDIGNVFAGEVTSTMGFGGFATKELEDLLKKGGLKDSELEETVAVLKEAGDSSNYLGNTLADAFVSVVAGFSKYSTDLKKEEILMTSAAEAVANLNQQLKDFINNLDYSFKDLSRQNEFEKNLRGVRQANTMLISESLYGKRDALQTQLDFDIEDVRSGTRTKELDISKKLLTTNIQDYYNLSDAQKTAYLQLSKSFDLSKPEENLKKIEGFIQTQFGTLDITKATDKQKDYLTIISNVRKDIAQTEKESADDLAIAAEKFKEALMAMELSRDFVFQFKAGFRDLATEGDQLIGTIGRQLPKMFADGLVDGIKAAIRESDNLGEALMGIASKFLDEISTMMMKSGIYQIVGAFAPSMLQGSVGLGAITPAGKRKGGLIRAQSGMYISGTGSGDKYPAMLENGEYVLNRRAVMAMGGPAALDTLNFSMAPRFASGGSFNAELDDIKAMEDGMTTFGLENSSYYKELRDAEIQRAEQARQKKRARQAQTAQMVGSLVASVATVAVGAGLQNVASNMQAKAAEKMVQSGTGAIASAGLAAYNDTPQLYAETGLSKAEVSNFQKYVKSGYISPTGMSTIRTPRTGFGSILPPKVRGIQTGGLIGSRLSDTIPGYMEGGLYNSPIVKQYGAGMQGGGMSSVANNSNTVNNTNANNSFNFNTSVNRDGTIQMGADSSTYKQQDVELSNNLNTKIYGAVLDVIREQQRFGGSLAGTRKA